MKMTTDITQYQKDWKLNHTVWDRYVKRNKNHLFLKSEYSLNVNDYGADHKVFEIIRNDNKRQVAIINLKKTLHLSFCIISIENDCGSMILL
jgi:hypothetical protein